MSIKTRQSVQYTVYSLAGQLLLFVTYLLNLCVLHSAAPALVCVYNHLAAAAVQSCVC